MYLQFQHSFAYTFPKAINKPININYPGPGTYNPGEDNEMINPPKWKFNTASRDNKIKELSPGPAKYDYGLDYRKLSNVPTAPQYTFYKTSGVIPRKRKKKNIKNTNYNNNINNFNLDTNFKEGNNTINLQNINKQRPKTTETKNKKKKKKYKLNNNYDDDSNPGVGTYNIRSSLIVPVVKFGTERKDIAYKNTPSRGPASYDIRGNLGNFGPKINFGKEIRGKVLFNLNPGPGNYNLRKENYENDAPKYSFKHEVRMKDESFNRKKIVLERNFLKRENYKKIYVFKEDNNVNVDQRNNVGYYVSDYNLSHTGFHIFDRSNFRKSKNGKFDSNYNTFSDYDKVEERKNYEYNNFRKPLWVSKKFYKQYLNEYLRKFKRWKKVEDEKNIEEDKIKVDEDERKKDEEKKINEDEKIVEDFDKKEEEVDKKEKEVKKIVEESDKKEEESDKKEKEDKKIVEESDKKEEEDEKIVDEEEKNIEEFDKKEEQDEKIVKESDKKEEEEEKVVEEFDKKEEEEEKVIEEFDKNVDEDEKIVKESDKKEEEEEEKIVEEFDKKEEEFDKKEEQDEKIVEESEIIENEESKLKEGIEIPLD